MRRLRIQSGLAAVALLSMACSAADIFHLGARDELGVIIYYGDTSRIVAPDTVLRGTSFSVSFMTFGGGCLHSPARTELAISGNRLQVTPYDHDSGGSVCTADLRLLPHEVQVRIDTPGGALMRIVGQQRGQSTGSANVPAELTRAIVVR